MNSEKTINATDGEKVDGVDVAADVSESKRARVRRLLIEPLTDQGMRFERGVTVEVQRKRLDRMADDLAYMCDDALIVLRRCLQRNGEGTRKCFWPARVSYLGFAHAFEYRSIEDDPAMLGWFASAAGSAAQQVAGRAVAEFEFWCAHWRPPYSDKDQRAVAAKASENVSRLAYCEPREDEGSLRDPDHIAWLKAYRIKAAKISGWITGGAA
jgi:hypothetical protein